ncbi:hypothetical protein OH76DRAFT_1062377 [Lentinus brumalis]|uniref:Uncharacterized protein n=1 Tax=Lentinus brumalis TaxID=2498619 RepID=A0A371DNJ4_9APHY|nr:hypothetical protein OH76DRAFT_1062377 [Polyporus brumalis]
MTNALWTDCYPLPWIRIGRRMLDVSQDVQPCQPLPDLRLRARSSTRVPCHSCTYTAISSVLIHSTTMPISRTRRIRRLRRSRPSPTPWGIYSTIYHSGCGQCDAWSSERLPDQLGAGKTLYSSFLTPDRVLQQTAHRRLSRKVWRHLDYR